MPLFAPNAPRSPYHTPLLLIAALAVLSGGLLALARQSGAAAVPNTPPDQQTYQPALRHATPEHPFPGLVPNEDALRAAAEIPRPDLDAFAPDFDRFDAMVLDAARFLAARPDDIHALDAFPRSEWHFNRLLREPDRWRFRVMHVHGLLARLEPEPVDAFTVDDEHPATLWRATLYDDRIGESYTVLAPLAADGLRASTSPRAPASPASADGVFLGWHALHTEQGLVPTPVFLARRIYLAHERATPPERLDDRIPGEEPREQRPLRPAAGLDPAFLDTHLFAPSYTEAERRMAPLPDPLEMATDLASEFPALAHTFAYAHTPPADGRRPEPALRYDDIMASDELPRWMRGQWAAVQGKAMDVRTIRLARPDEVGLDRLHIVTVRAGRLADGQSRDWAVAVLNLPEGLRFDDDVRATGVFLKRYPFRAYHEGRAVWRWAPLIVAPALTRVPPQPPPTGFYMAVALLTAAVTVVLWLAVRRGNREAEALRVHVKARRRVRGGRAFPLAASPRRRSTAPVLHAASTSPETGDASDVSARRVASLSNLGEGAFAPSAVRGPRVPMPLRRRRRRGRFPFGVQVRAARTPFFHRTLRRR